MVLFSDDDGSGLSGQLQTIAADEEDANAKELSGIYYINVPYTDRVGGADYEKGDRLWLRRTGTRSDGNINFQIISVRQGVEKFPEAMPYEHMNYGMWAALEDGTGDNDTPSGLGTAFVNALSGKAMTPAADMPTSGKATYNGHWLANVRERSEDGNGNITEEQGGSETMADFAKNTVTVKLSTAGTAGQGEEGSSGGTLFATMEGAIGGEMMSRNGFSADTVKVDSETTVGVTATGKFTGTMNGNFFGPKFEEVGGVFDFTSEDKKAGEFRGAFGGRRGE